MATNTSKAYSKNEMPLLAHLIELRTRMIKAVLAVLLLFAALIAFANDIYLILVKPLMEQLPENSEMVATGLIDPFFTPFKLVLILSFFLAIPVILHQLWAFIAPGLYKREQKTGRAILLSSILLFYSGMVFCYYVVFPLMFQFFPSVVPEGIRYIPDMTNSLNIMIKLFFAFGLAFEVPIFTVVAVLSGATTIEKLQQSRAYIIVAAFAIGMLLTPPDMISQTLLAVPMWLLFEIGLIFARWFKIEQQATKASHKAPSSTMAE
ncbi:twin-arginine translocase subunit TatC [Glaciecola siphonariae]|uniref:Sec-independent protein translocase protein TatC n=1 Tax=Glaciecola siphonariae TaxID=521012 RepID=A0ABV9LR69_9ALTE